MSMDLSDHRAEYADRGLDPADMDPILEIARRRGVQVLEDPSHAHGARYKGRLVGTMGDVAGFSLMSGKSLACGEGGIMITDDPEIAARAAQGQYALVLRVGL